MSIKIAGLPITHMDLQRPYGLAFAGLSFRRLCSLFISLMCLCSMDSMCSCDYTSKAYSSITLSLRNSFCSMASHRACLVCSASCECLVLSWWGRESTAVDLHFLLGRLEVGSALRVFLMSCILGLALNVHLGVFIAKVKL